MLQVLRMQQAGLDSAGFSMRGMVTGSVGRLMSNARSVDTEQGPVWRGGAIARAAAVAVPVESVRRPTAHERADATHRPWKCVWWQSLHTAGAVPEPWPATPRRLPVD